MGTKEVNAYHHLRGPVVDLATIAEARDRTLEVLAPLAVFKIIIPASLTCANASAEREPADPDDRYGPPSDHGFPQDLAREWHETPTPCR